MNARLARSISMFTIVPVRVAGRPAAGRRRRRAAVAARRRRRRSARRPRCPPRRSGEWAPHATCSGPCSPSPSLALLTRCLHLDGLADTADGLGSGAPAARALEIMRKSDIGPFGVVTLIFVLGADVAALGCLQGGPWTPVGVLAIAAATGRVAARARGRPRGRVGPVESGSGALVADGVSVAGRGRVDRRRARPRRRRRRSPAGSRSAGSWCPRHRAGRRDLASALHVVAAAGRDHRRRIRRADRVGDRDHAGRRGAAVRGGDGPGTWPRPVPLVGDTTSAAARSADPAGWAFGEPTVAALHTVLAARRDIRRYRPDPVPPDLLREVLTAGPPGAVGRPLAAVAVHRRHRAGRRATRRRCWRTASGCARPSC